MALKYLVNIETSAIDMKQHELSNVIIHPVTTLTRPSTPIEGQSIYNSTTKAIEFWNGTNWVASSGDITSISAGNGLSGGGTEGDISLGINVDDVTIQITSDAIEAKTAAVSNGSTALATGDQIYDFVIGQGYSTTSGTVTSVSGTGTVSGLTLSGTVTDSGNLTLGGTLTLTSGQITTGLGYTPYDATNPEGYTSFAEPGIFSGGGTPTLASGVTAEEIRTLIGAGTSSSSGTVTSIAVAGNDGITASGSPITSSGTITLGITDGSITNSKLANNTITIGTTVISLGAESTLLNGLTSLDFAAGNRTIGASIGANNLTLGGSTSTVVIPGDLQVTGTTTTNNVEVVSTTNGVIFEGNTADDNEVTLLAEAVTADRTIVLPDASGTVALTSDTSNDQITITAGNALTGGGTFTLNGSTTTVTINHEDTSSQASVNNSGRTYIQDVTLDEYGHVTALTSSTETVVNTDNQLATAAALIDVSAMGANTTASFNHNLASKNLIVQIYDVTTGEVVFANIDHTSINSISVIFAQTPINDIRVVVIDAKNNVTDSTVTYS